MGETPRTVEVQYTDGETILVKAVSWMETDDLWDLLKVLMTDFVARQLYIGEFLRPSNKTVISTLRKVCKMIPVVGGGEVELDRLDAETIVDLFVVDLKNTQVNDIGQIVTPEGETYLPGAIARLHQFDFFALAQAASKSRGTKKATTPRVNDPTTDSEAA